MKISGFTFLRNASKLYYPVKESILSVLDLVDEFVIAVGDNDADDNTHEILKSIGSDKIKIVDTVWELDKYPNGTVYAHQTDIAKEACTGDWLFYLQGDEVVHEKDLPVIRNACEQYINQQEVEGFLFEYLHFFGDYQHYFSDHCWYRNEVRIIRNKADIHSVGDAQSFRRIPDFDGVSYKSKKGSHKLKVISLEARIFHYGWVRPPALMGQKKQYADINYAEAPQHTEMYAENFDYGRLDRALVFKESHPAVMQAKIAELDWQAYLRFSGPDAINRPLMKHEKLKYRLINLIERKLNKVVFGGYRNYVLIGKEHKKV